MLRNPSNIRRTELEAATSLSSDVFEQNVNIFSPEIIKTIMVCEDYFSLARDNIV